MRKILYLDAACGVSGDMFVGALLDVGAGLAAVQQQVAALGLDGIQLRAQPVTRRGVQATKFEVLDAKTGRGVEVSPPGGQRHRGLDEILSLLDAADLPDPVARSAKAIFERLGHAEAEVHGVPVAAVHFHEVGALDAIADVVSAAAAFHQLGVDDVWCSPINVGSGQVRCAHGTLPVPAPATALLLEGVPTYAEGPRCELTTPTGAALVRHFCRNFGDPPPLEETASGCGAGSRNLTAPNVLRAILGLTRG